MQSFIGGGMYWHNNHRLIIPKYYGESAILYQSITFHKPKDDTKSTNAIYNTHDGASKDKVTIQQLRVYWNSSRYGLTQAKYLYVLSCIHSRRVLPGYPCNRRCPRWHQIIRQYSNTRGRISQHTKNIIPCIMHVFWVCLQRLGVSRPGFSDSDVPYGIW